MIAKSKKSASKLQEIDKQNHIIKINQAKILQKLSLDNFEFNKIPTIAIIGNCQMLSTAFYLQQNTDKYLIKWCLYSESFIRHLGRWTDKCNDIMILDVNDCIEFIKEADIIICQKLSLNASKYFNYNLILTYIKQNCKIITIPSIYCDMNDFDNSIKELQKRELENNNDILVSKIIIKNKNNYPMITINHPTTIIFITIVNIIFTLINHPKICPYLRNYYLEKSNFIELP